MHTRFRDRSEAGRFLARLLDRYRGAPRVLVLALPRGGVPVAYEVALALQAPLDVFLVRKLGVPGQSELAMGAIASGGVMVLNDDILRQLRVSEAALERVVREETRELERRAASYRGARAEPPIAGATVILIDDGLATGATMLVAIKAIRALGPERIVVAVPVATPETKSAVAQVADEIMCPLTPDPLHAVGAWYDDFSETEDDEVRLLLRRAALATGTDEAGF